MPGQRRVLDFGDGTEPILLDYPDTRIFSNCSSYGDRVPGLSWNEFTVHHRGQLEYQCNPQQAIMEAIYEAVDGAEFYPVHYQRGPREDTFLARNCKQAIDNLFKLSLAISVGKGASIPIKVQLAVAESNMRQISPHFLIASVLDNLLKRLEQQNGVDGLLNLDNFGARPEFRNVVVSLANPAILMNVCQVIRNDPACGRVNGFIMTNNHIREVRYLNLLSNVDYALLDLSGNKIRSAERLCRDLAQFRARELLLNRNPIAKSNKFPGNIKALENNFQMVNGLPFNKLHKAYSPLDGEIDLYVDGTRIDEVNAFQLPEFEHSQHWHAFLVPDPHHEFQQESFFNMFFIYVDPNLSEFYPCYYRYDRGEHIFLVRNCYDQIANLVNNFKLQMEIPAMPMFPEKRSFGYYLRMNVSTFKKQHVVPEECLIKAVERRYAAQNRLLDLEQLQASESLRNVVVHLSSPKILTNVLSVASKQFMTNCSEIRLCNNKILTVQKAHILRRMGNLRAVDLSHNWLHELSAIESLSELPLKSLVLYGNPLCRNYCLPSEYVRAVTQMFPQLTTLDGVDLQTNPGQAPQKDFLCDIAAYELVGDVFLKDYLREFEGQDERANLHKYYTDDSLFTMTSTYKMPSHYINGHLVRRISKYSTHARNLLKSDISRAANGVHVGKEEIMVVLMQLPKVTHDFHSLQTDVMYYDGKSAVINVTGLLRDEQPDSRDKSDFFLAFSRQFVIKIDDEGQGISKGARRIRITNERFNIMNPSQKMIRSAFKVNYPDHTAEKEKDSVDTKDYKLLIFQEITGLISPWCTSIVEQADWDLERALKLFIQKNAANEIPDQAIA
ncbi:nuclear RNA export factor 2 [Drosophila kikkawai]|uniref:Nuclear RNA export factor 2 n=1 Tax=Drosophila kikkawai TaxID=30033 RepID=A0A6P4IN93_DROKI|nr:nuclear RNA export factor 2 [Drosophila kikkawai]XP_017029924.1 nuclear RNA export factor 2 [Drosophila kikkawai]XP_017029925.1 nuclear RNA export factor 2 [Drosophila kikkawai]